MPNPLDPLQKARGIGDPWANVEVTQQAMPLGPWTGAFPGATALSALKRYLWPAVSKAAPVLKSAGTAATKALETLGEANPEFTPTGAEEFYNLGKRTLQHPVDATLTAYQKILGNGGR